MVAQYWPLLLLFVGGSVLTVGDLVMKKWVSSGHNIPLYVFGMVVYITGLSFMVESFKYKNAAIASAILVIFNVATLSIVSWLYFKEALTPLQMVGIFIGLISIVFMELG